MNTSLRSIFCNQSKLNCITGCETLLNDFILKARAYGFPHKEIVNGLSEYYRQTVSSAEGIVSRLNDLLSTSPVLAKNYSRFIKNLDIRV